MKLFINKIIYRHHHHHFWYPIYNDLSLLFKITFTLIPPMILGVRKFHYWWNSPIEDEWWPGKTIRLFHFRVEKWRVVHFPLRSLKIYTWFWFLFFEALGVKHSTTEHYVPSLILVFILNQLMTTLNSPFTGLKTGFSHSRLFSLEQCPWMARQFIHDSLVPFK